MTVTTIRPTTAAKSTGLTLVGGTLGGVLSDDNNASWATVASGQQWPNGYGLVNMGDIVLSGISAGAGDSNRIKACRIRGRVQLNASDPGHGASVNLLFRSSITGKQNGSTWFSTTSTVNVSDRTGAWVTQHPNGVEWPQAGVNNIQIALGWHYSVGSNHVNIRLNELYMDIDVRARPQVSGVTVAGNDTSTRPTITWTYTPNNDNDPENWYRVKVFSAAQIAAAGFNPDTSTATYDSGEIAGDAESLTLDNDLATGITYTTYVAGAMNFNGVPWYSAWATSSTFSITLTPPAIPTLTLTADATVPYMRNKLTVTQNLNMLTVQQSGLEDGTTTGWEVGTACTIASTQSVFADGLSSLQVTSTSAATMRAQTLSGILGIPVIAGQQYTGIIWVRTASVAKSCFASIRWYDVTGAFLSASDGTASNDTTTFAARTVTATAPANARYAAISATWTTPSAGGEVHYLDHNDFHVGSSTAFSPAGASTIIETAWVTNTEGNLIHPQLWSGGEYEKNSNGFFATGASSTDVYDPSDQYHGIGSIRWYVDDTTSALYIGWPSGTQVNPSPVYPMAAVPGRPYSFSLRARASQTFSSTLVVEAIDKDGSIIGSPSTTGISITTSWTEFKIQNFVVPSGAVWCRAHLDNAGSVTGRTVNVDACRWYQATTVPTALEQSTGGVATSWMPVRGANVGNLPVVYQDSKVYVHDLEVPCGYTVMYRARNFSPATDTLPAVSSDPTAVISTMMDNPGVWVLSVPGDGRLRAQVRVTDYSQSRHEESETFYPLRPGGFSLPVVTSDFMGGSDGSITIKTKTEEEWRQLNDLIRLQRTLFLVHPDFGARYIRITERAWEIVQLDKTMTWLRKVTLPVLEVDRPAT